MNATGRTPVLSLQHPPHNRRAPFARVLPVLLTLLACPGWGLGEEPSLDVSANRDRIYLGESVHLTVTLSGTRQTPQPDLSGIERCRVELLGSRSESRTNMQFINGKLERTSFHGRIYTFALTPSTPGRFRAGPVQVEADGRILTRSGPIIEVMGIEEQDRVLVRLVSSRESVLVDEPFEITLSVLLRKLPGRYSLSDPLDPYQPPILTVPYLNGKPIEGLEGPDLQTALQNRLVSERQLPGFAINDYTVQSGPLDMRSMFDLGGRREPRRAKFSLDRQSTEHDGKSYFEYTLTLGYTPKEEGSHTFGPAVFKGMAGTDVDASGHLTTDAIFAVGPAVTVRVVPPPEEGRPASYVGAIGTDMAVESQLDTQTCSVGDPLSLTLSISGGISLQNVRPPALNLQTNLTHDFRIYGDTVKPVTTETGKQYVYTIRPTRAGTLEFPPVDVSYFDTGVRAYKTVRTLAIPIRANEAVQVGGDMIIDTVPDRGGGSHPEGSGSGPLTVAPLNVSRTGAEARDLIGGVSCAVLALPAPIVYGLIVLVAAIRRHRPALSRRNRRRSALRRAVARIDEAQRCAGSDGRRACLLLCDTVREYISSRCGSTPTAITPADVKPILEADIGQHDAIDTLAVIFARTFDALYGQIDTAPDVVSDCRETKSLLRELDRVSQRTHRASVGPGAVLLAMAILLPSTFASAQEARERAFIWDEANAKMAAAETHTEYLEAAEAYLKLVETGVRNGPLFYNLGTALLQASQYDAALAVLERAERYMGSTWEVRRNMRVTLAAQAGDEEPEMRWYRYPLFWHFGLAARARLTVAATAFACLWAALALRMTPLRRTATALATFAAATIVLFGSSVLTSVHQEAENRRQEWRLRVLVQSVVAETHGIIAEEQP